MFFGVGREPSDVDALLPSVRKSISEGQFTTEKLFQDGIHWINPLSSLKTLPNMSLAHASIHAGSMGPNMTLYGKASFRQAVEAEDADDAATRITAARSGSRSADDDAVIWQIWVP